MRLAVAVAGLFSLGCSGALVPSISKGGGGVFDADSPFPAYLDGSTDDAPPQDSSDGDTGSWDTGSWDTGSLDTGGSDGACPFSGDSTELSATYNVDVDDCDWGSDAYFGSALLSCNDDGTFTYFDPDFLSVDVICTLSGNSFSCLLDGDLTAEFEGRFSGGSAAGTWLLDLGSCYNSGEFVWD